MCFNVDFHTQGAQHEPKYTTDPCYMGLAKCGPPFFGSGLVDLWGPEGSHESILGAPDFRKLPCASMDLGLYTHKTFKDLLQVYDGY